MAPPARSPGVVVAFVALAVAALVVWLAILLVVGGAT
jgi:hypothetical protein